jgi:hypothetical protein
MKYLILAATALGLLMIGPAAAASKHKVSQCRDAKTGAFVSAAYAKKYPGLTVCETRK